MSGNLVVQKCFDPRSDGQGWGPVGEDDCEVDQMNTTLIQGASKKMYHSNFSLKSVPGA